ncbi:MAG TPA: hypothetical protein VFS09_07895 [Candidatus Eisenbacteria bacterium]|nr:hypothetical protein [Candidatus Eisenbacteria bacterium]
MIRRSCAARVRPFALGLLALVSLAGCAPSEEESRFLARKALLIRQNQGIRELIAEEERGSLVPKDRFLLGIDERLVADILTAQLPLERPLGKRFRVRIDSATVLLRDKFGVITIDGTIFRPKTPDRRTALQIFGGLGAVVIDSTTHMLSIAIAIDHIELTQAGMLENVIGRGGKKFLAEKGRALLQDQLPKLEVPVALARNIRVPAIAEGAVQLDSLEVPLDMSVERVIAAGGKLWVTLNAEVGAVKGAEEGLGVSIKKKKKGAGAGTGTGAGPGTGTAAGTGS